MRCEEGKKETEKVEAIAGYWVVEATVVDVIMMTISESEPLEGEREKATLLLCILESPRRSADSLL